MRIIRLLVLFNLSPLCPLLISIALKPLPNFKIMLYLFLHAQIPNILPITLFYTGLIFSTLNLLIELELKLFPFFSGSIYLTHQNVQYLHFASTPHYQQTDNNWTESEHRYYCQQMVRRSHFVKLNLDFDLFFASKSEIVRSFFPTRFK